MEELDIIDANDVVVGKAAKNEIYKHKHQHRIVHILVYNKDGDLLLQKRSASKSYLPGYWVTSAGGHVQAGESYEEGALRELEEEIGITGSLIHVDTVWYNDSRELKKRLGVFKLIHEGPFTPLPEEVSDVKFVPPEAVKSEELLHPELVFLIEKGLV